MAHRPDLVKPDKASKHSDGKALPLGVEDQTKKQQSLSTSLWEFEPSTYVSKWGGRAPYSLLAEAFSTLEGTTGEELQKPAACPLIISTTLPH